VIESVSTFSWTTFVYLRFIVVVVVVVRFWCEESCNDDDSGLIESVLAIAKRIWFNFRIKCSLSVLNSSILCGLINAPWFFDIYLRFNG
jgi:hypothetical protein